MLKIYNFNKSKAWAYKPVCVHCALNINGIDGDENNEESIDDVGSEVGNKTVEGDGVVSSQEPQELTASRKQ